MKIKLKHQAILANKKAFLSPSDRGGEIMGALNSQENSFSVYNSLLSHGDTVEATSLRIPVLNSQCCFSVHPFSDQLARLLSGKREKSSCDWCRGKAAHTEPGGELLQEILHRIITNAVDGQCKLLSYSFRTQGEAVCRGTSGPYIRRRHQF